jgi:hypothetical protein
MVMSSRSGSTSEPAAAWLLRNGAVLAAVEDRRTRRPRSVDGAVVIRSPALVQTLTTALALDVAWCACAAGRSDGPECFEVRRTTSMAPRRVGVPLLHGALVLAPSGAFERWHLQVGDVVEVLRG